MSARGVLHVHSCPPALCPHVSWAVARELGVRVDLPWSDQPASVGMLRTEAEWRGRPGTAARLAAALKGWSPLAVRGDRARHAWLRRRPVLLHRSLGLFHAVTSANGDVMVGEDRLAHAACDRRRPARRPGPAARDGLGRRARAVPSLGGRAAGRPARPRRLTADWRSAAVRVDADRRRAGPAVP